MFSLFPGQEKERKELELPNSHYRSSQQHRWKNLPEQLWGVTLAFCCDDAKYCLLARVQSLGGEMKRLFMGQVQVPSCHFKASDAGNPHGLPKAVGTADPLVCGLLVRSNQPPSRVHMGNVT